MPSVDKNIEIVVIGGGLSGFSVAIMLHNYGYHNVTVYERDTSLSQRRQGYGLTILQGINALKALGTQLFERVKDLDTPSRSHYIFDNRGNLINFFGTVFWSQPAIPVSVEPTKKSKKKYNLHISRTNLRNIIHDELLKISPNVEWNHKLDRIEKLSENDDDQKVNVRFSNGKSIKADLVIGCDGIKSITRRFQYTDDIPLNYLGMIMILGITHVGHPLAQQRVFQTVDGCTRLFGMPYASNDPDGSNFMWQLSFPLDEPEAIRLSSNLKLLKEHLMERCGDWHDPIPSMIQNTDLTLMMGIPAYDREAVLPKKKSISNSVLLGDAAHPMSPFKGQGANQALLDAVSLAKAISESETISKAIDKYESEMMNRVKPKIDISRERVTTFHNPNILSSDSFEYRGSNHELLARLKEKLINYDSGEKLESLIMNEMKDLKLI